MTARPHAAEAPAPQRRKPLRTKVGQTLSSVNPAISAIVSQVLTVAALALATFASGCHRAPPTAIDRAMASCLPADTVILGGVDCQRLRASPVYKELPTAVTAWLEPLRPATYLLLASNGKDYLVIARGRFG